MWQVNKGGKFSTLAEAQDYAAHLRLGGYEGWRLPTMEESLGLLQIIFWKQNGDCRMDSQGDYWTASSDGQASLGHWEDYLLCGSEFKYVRSLKSKGYVRAIRSMMTY
ncbi:MAG: Lcl C-terminal domain-containing protein [Desulfobulbaceae bacterium]